MSSHPRAIPLPGGTCFSLDFVETADPLSDDTAWIVKWLPPLKGRLLDGAQFHVLHRHDRRPKFATIQKCHTPAAENGAKFFFQSDAVFWRLTWCLCTVACLIEVQPATD